MAGLSERGVYSDQDGKVAPSGRRRETCWRGISSGHIRAEDRVELFRWREMTALAYRNHYRRYTPCSILAMLGQASCLPRGPCQGRGRGFEPLRPLQIFLVIE